jgi:polyisoprenoid-binding protein YceI
MSFRDHFTSHPSNPGNNPTTAVPPPVSRSSSATVERWMIDSQRSSLEFTLRHLVIQQIRGRFSRWGGELFLDRVEPWLSSVQVWIDLASIETGSPERDAHVRSPEFLDVARFPRAELRSTHIDVRDARVTLHGRLEMHGVLGDVELDVEPAAVTATGGVDRARYAARGTLDRQTFGLHWNQDLDLGGVVVGDRIEIIAEVELVRAASDPTPAPR